MPRKKETPIKTSVKSGNFRPTKSGAGMTKKGVAAYRKANPGSKLKTAVTGKVKKGSKDAKRRKSFCARSAGQMKKFPKAAKNPNSRLRPSSKKVEVLMAPKVEVTLAQLEKREEFMMRLAIRSEIQVST